jgi:Asp/Glu/hydantoin racemase
MSRRILLVNPIGTDIMDQLTIDVVAPALMGDTEVECRSLGGPGVPPSPFLAPAQTYTNQLLAMVAGAAGEGFDAVAICCSGDPALALAKSISAIPVVGANEAACRTAATIGGKVTFLQRRLPQSFVERMPTQRSDHWLRALVASYGLADHDVEVRPVPVPEHPSYDETMALAASAPDKLRDVVLNAMQSAALAAGVEQSLAAAADGTRSVYFNCTFWGGLLGPVAERVPVRVLDPLIVTAKYAEHLAVVA